MLKYFLKEIGSLHTDAVRFSEKHPETAGYLRKKTSEFPDPHSDRLRESFAFLTGRLHQLRYQEFKRLNNDLLEHSFPEWIRPIPSMSIAQLEPDHSLAGNELAAIIPERNVFEISTKDAQNIRLSTVFPVNWSPFRIIDTSLVDAGQFDSMPFLPIEASVLKMNLKYTGNVSSPKPCRPHSGQLRFFINANPADSNTIYESLFHNLSRIAIRKKEDSAPMFFSPDHLKEAGFQDRESLYPSQAYTLSDYRLLTEYFIFPEKFYFFELSDIPQMTGEDDLEISFILKHKPDLTIDESSFLLNCTPVVNLFSQYAESICLDKKLDEYPVIPSYRYGDNQSVHSVFSVSLSDRTSEEEVILPPCFGTDFYNPTGESTPTWSTRRNLPPKGQGQSDISIVLHQSETLPEKTDMYIQTLCTNGKISEKMQVGTQLSGRGHYSTFQAKLIRNPTVEYFPTLEGESIQLYNQLIQLQKTYLSDFEVAVSGLHSVLSKLNIKQNPVNLKQIHGIKKIEIKDTPFNDSGSPWKGFKAGKSVLVTLDASSFEQKIPYLFCRLLHDFFKKVSGINHKVETLIYFTGNNELQLRYAE